MNNESDNPDMGHDDRIVSSTYREIATQAVPEALNRSILKQAAAAAKPRRTLQVSWTRPMAWVATIGLTLAIVIDVAQVPQSELSLPVPLEAELDELANSKRHLEQAVPSDIPEEAVLQGTPARKSRPEAARERAAVSPQALQTPQPLELLEMKRDDERDARPANDMQKASADQGMTEEVIVMDSNLNVDADNFAVDPGRQRLESRAATPASASLAAENTPTAAFRQSQDPACDKDARATQTSWLACIERLEKAGHEDVAEDELEQLIRSFPDYVPQ